jgi:hypothetical protein
MFRFIRFVWGLFFRLVSFPPPYKTFFTHPCVREVLLVECVESVGWY